MDGGEVRHNGTRGPWVFRYGSLQKVEQNGASRVIWFLTHRGKAEGLGQDHKGLETIQKTGKTVITAEEN